MQCLPSRLAILTHGLLDCVTDLGLDVIQTVIRQNQGQAESTDHTVRTCLKTTTIMQPLSFHININKCTEEKKGKITGAKGRKRENSNDN